MHLPATINASRVTKIIPGKDMNQKDKKCIAILDDFTVKGIKGYKCSNKEWVYCNKVI